MHKLIDQHIHGGFGIDFSKCSAQDFILFSEKFAQRGFYGFFPTLVTDKIDNIKIQIQKIKEAKSMQTSAMAKILGIHIEGIFINPLKKGIHNPSDFLPLSVENFQKIEDDLIKIVTLAPELDEDHKLQKYLKRKGIKVQAGHCVGGDLSDSDGVTHIFNAMEGISHRKTSTALSALINDDLYTEFIGDRIHLSEDTIKMILKSKPFDKLILISDALPIAGSELSEMEFCGEKIYNKDGKAVSKEGTIAGSTMFIDEVIKKFNMPIEFASDNIIKYHNIEV